VRTKPPQTTEQITLTECAVLGMLSRKERSGYDLLKAIERSVGFFWTPAKSQLYALLPKLVERGLLEARRIEQDKRPDKTVYRITKTGRAALREGLEQASPAVDRNPFELRVFFGEHMRPGAVRAMIEARHDHQRAHLAILEEIERDPAVVSDTYPYLTLLAGKENAKAAIRWAEQALQILDERA
jgi:DNA-binding PadR family transcriptional regulator